MFKKIYLLLIGIFYIGSVLHAQKLHKPKKIKKEGNYTQSATNIVFPENIDGYLRSDLSTFDKAETDITATYKDDKTTVTVYVYPAEYASGSYLRREFIYSLKAIAVINDRNIEATESLHRYEKNGYKINGFHALVDNPDETKTALEIYGCGVWHFKIRISTQSLDTIAINDLFAKTCAIFKPEELVKISNLSLAPQITISRNALSDSLLLGCTMGEALGEAKWSENIDKTELISGFPDVYLDMHISGVKAFIKFADEHKDFMSTKTTYDYIDQLRTLIANGFLDEYILEYYNNLLIRSEKENVDFKAYNQWKMLHPVNIDMMNYSMVSYKPQ